MNTIEKILIVQIAFFFAGIIGYYLLNFDLANIIANHIVLTIGYLYGFWDGKKKA